VTVALKAVTSPEMPLVTSAVCAASSLIASATTAKPLPCSPARAATMRALMARIPTSDAISPMRAVLYSTAFSRVLDRGDAVPEGADPFGHAVAVRAGGLHPLHAVARMIDGACRSLRHFGHGGGGGTERALDLGGAAAQVRKPGCTSLACSSTSSGAPRCPRFRSPACPGRRPAVARARIRGLPDRRSGPFGVLSGGADYRTGFCSGSCCGSASPPFSG
jgi:hypothetical protein